MSEPKEHVSKKPLQNFLEIAQDALIRRFGRPAKQPEPVVFEFTNDKGLLHQYYMLRDRMIGGGKAMLENDNGQEVHDKISEILVARRGKVLIGACRLTIREGDESYLFHIENEDFKLRNLFPHLPLNHERHGVISKLVILEEHHGSEILYGLCRAMYDRVVALDVHYIFVRSKNYVLARNWRLIANSFGAKHTEICKEIEMPIDPIFPEEKPYLSFSDLSELCRAEHPRIRPPAARKLELVE